MIYLFIKILLLILIPNVTTIFITIWILKKEKVLLFPLVLIWALILLCGIALVNSNFFGFLMKASPDGVVSGLGSFAGALLAGILTAAIALFIMDRQFKNERNVVNKKETNSILNTMLMLGYWFSPAINLTKNMVSNIKNNNIKNIAIELNELKSHIDELKKIDLTPLPYGIYLKSYYLIHNLVQFHEFVDGIIQLSGALSLNTQISKLESDFEETEKIFNELIQIQSEKTRELKSLG